MIRRLIILLLIVGCGNIDDYHCNARLVYPDGRSNWADNVGEVDYYEVTQSEAEEMCESKFIAENADTSYHPRTIDCICGNGKDWPFN